MQAAPCLEFCASPLKSDARIYLYLGVGQRRVYGDAVPIVYDLGDPSSFKLVNEKPQFDDGPATFYSLLLSCRTIYSEVSAVLYSANWFVIHYQPRQSLKPLRALTPHALASLSNIKIVLNQASCHRRDPENTAFGPCCGRSWAYRQARSPNGSPMLLRCCVHGDDHDHLLTKESSRVKAIVEEWQKTAAYLASHIVPGKLELSLVCDVGRGEVEVANLVLDGVRTATSDYAKRVTPSKEVMWERSSSVGGYYIKRPPCYEEWGPGYCKPECRQACQFSHCWRTTFPQPSIGCFCRARHTAVSSRCKCWAPPTPLFLVCRTLYAEANMVFYSENRFIVVDSPGINPFQSRPPGDYPHKSFAASYFLRKVVPTHCLQYIRFLEIVFSAFSHENRPRDDHPAFRDWDKTVDWAKDKLNLPVLTLRLVVAAHPYPGRGPSWSGEMMRGQGKEVLATYNRIPFPLQRLGRAEGGGLARFYAKLPWPLRWSNEVRRRLEDMDPEAGSDWLESKDREIKVRVEKFVMGERYEPVSAAGAEPQMSVWWWGALDLFV